MDTKEFFDEYEKVNLRKKEINIKLQNMSEEEITEYDKNTLKEMEDFAKKSGAKTKKFKV